MPSKQSVQHFGETLLTVIQNERDRRLRLEEFNREMGWRNRQLNFTAKYQEGLLERGQQQEDRLREQNIANLIGSGFRTGGQLGRENIRTGERDIQEPAFELFGEKFGFPPQQAPEPFTGDRYETISNNVVGTGKFKGQKVNLAYDKKEQEQVQFPVHIDPNKDTTKDPKLTQSASDGLAFLKDPVYNVVGQDKGLTADEISNKFTKSINALKKDVLGSRATVWFDTMVREFGRMPTSDELDREIVKHGEGKEFAATLTDVEIGQLRRLSGYLEDAETGIKRTQKKLKEMRTLPKESGGLLGIGVLGL